MNSNSRYFTPAKYTPKFSLQRFALRSTVLTIFLNMCNIIGMGHGIAPLGIVEVLSPFFLFNESSEDEFTSGLKLFVILSFLGQGILTLSFFLKLKDSSAIAKVIGLIILWTGFIIWIIPQSDLMFTFTLSFGIPFAISSLFLIYKIGLFFFKENKLS